MQPKIRKAKSNDAAKIALLFDAYRQFYKKPADYSLALSYITERLERQESVILVAEDEKQNLLGFCQLYPTFCSLELAKILALYDLFVTPSARRFGIGKSLLEAAELYARQAGAVRLDLTTAIDNRTAQSLYESLGWVKDDIYYAYNLSVTD